MAGVFALGHFVLYRFEPPYTALSVQALTTLLLAGFAFNEFFLATGSIAVPWAIHLGWNLTRLGRDWVGLGLPGVLEEGPDFNLIEGNPWVMVLAAGLALVASAARFRLFSCRVCSNLKALP
jgi:hypothetical protein